MLVGQTTVSEERTTNEVQARDILLELTYQSNIIQRPSNNSPYVNSVAEV